MCDRCVCNRVCVCFVSTFLMLCPSLNVLPVRDKSWMLNEDAACFQGAVTGSKRPPRLTKAATPAVVKVDPP